MPAVPSRIRALLRSARAIPAAVSHAMPRRLVDGVLVVAAFALVASLIADRAEEPARTVALVVLGLVLAGLAFWKIPQWQANTARRRRRGGDKSHFELENEARRTLAEALGGLLLVVGLAVTWQQFDASRDEQRSAANRASTEQAATREQQQTAAAQAAAEQALALAGQQAAATEAAADRELARQGQLTERFTTAVSQLGDERLQIRLGGIYGLEQIAEDSREDIPAVLEVLAAFVRQRAPWPSVPGSATPIPDANGDVRPAADVQAVLTVIERERWAARWLEERGGRETPGRRWGDGWSRPVYLWLRAEFGLSCIDLSRTDLRGAVFGGTNLSALCLYDANLAGAYLGWADLGIARLQNTELTGAYLGSAFLTDATLTDANLTDANLRDAILAGADLTNADLTAAFLMDATLVKADLTGANLRDATLAFAVLTNADLRSAFGLTQGQVDSARFLDDPPQLSPHLHPPGVARPATPPASPVP